MSCCGTPRNSSRTRRSGCPGTTATPWRGWPWPQPRNIMALPGRKGSSTAGQIDHRQMPVKRAAQKSKSDDVFGQARGPAKLFRAGLYARVSTNDQQTLAMQNRAMREYAERRGWTIAMQSREVKSGSAQREARDQV